MLEYLGQAIMSINFLQTGATIIIEVLLIALAMMFSEDNMQRLVVILGIENFILGLGLTAAQIDGGITIIAIGILCFIIAVLPGNTINYFRGSKE